METNQQGEKTKHMYLTWEQISTTPPVSCAVISAPFKSPGFYLWLMFSPLNFVNMQYFFSALQMGFLDNSVKTQTNKNIWEETYLRKQSPLLLFLGTYTVIQ